MSMQGFATVHGRGPCAGFWMGRVRATGAVRRVLDGQSARRAWISICGRKRVDHKLNPGGAGGERRELPQSNAS